MANPSADLDRLYSILGKLGQSDKQGMDLRGCDGGSTFSARGVYFFREPGETRESSPDSGRIVRVGTHAVSANSKSTLWQRLRTHRGTRDGRGNHRASIFRLHVGAALLARDVEDIATWGVGSNAPPALRESQTAQAAELAMEIRVSEYIGSMNVLWVDVADEPGPSSVRAIIEQNTIALLSNRFAPKDASSADWLGRHSPKESIRRSGLWNLNYVDQAYDPNFLTLLEVAVGRTVARRK